MPRSAGRGRGSGSRKVTAVQMTRMAAISRLMPACVHACSSTAKASESHLERDTAAAHAYSAASTVCISHSSTLSCGLRSHSAIGEEDNTGELCVNRPAWPGTQSPGIEGYNLLH